MTLQESAALSILDSALRSEFGLVVRASLFSDGSAIATPSARAKQLLYRIRTDFTDYHGLQIRLSPTDPSNELWIVNQRGAQALPASTDEVSIDSL